MIRILKLLSGTTRSQKQRVIADDTFHPQSPIPDWHGSNRCLPCCMSPWSGQSQTQIVCNGKMPNRSTCGGKFDLLSDWADHIRTAHGVLQLFKWHCNVCDIDLCTSYRNAQSASHLKSVTHKCRRRSAILAARTFLSTSPRKAGLHHGRREDLKKPPKTIFIHLVLIITQESQKT